MHKCLGANFVVTNTQDIFILLKTQTGEGDAIWEGMGQGVTPESQNISHVTEPPAVVSLIHLESHLFN